jgi:hypothetical protein
MGLPFHPQPKGKTRKQAKAKKQRAERDVKRRVRAIVADRDGYCRFARGVLQPFARGVDKCQGPSEWAHIAGHRRSQTRGLAPEVRHGTATSVMLCRKHHRMEEAGRLQVIAESARGCNGTLRFTIKGT